MTTIMAFQESGLWPLISYVAGVSGSCWALGTPFPACLGPSIIAELTFPFTASMYTLPLTPPLTAPLSAAPLLDHFRKISGTHPLSTKGVNAVADAEGGVQSLLGPLIAKNKSGQEVCSELRRVLR